MSDKLSLRKDLMCPDCGEAIRKNDKTKLLRLEGKDQLLHAECAELVMAEEKKEAASNATEVTEQNNSEASTEQVIPPQMTQRPTGNFVNRHTPQGGLAHFPQELTHWVKHMRATGRIVI